MSELVRRAIERHPLLSAEDEIKLGRLIQSGDLEARNKLVLHNIRLVVKQISRFYHGSDPDKWNEMLNVGMIGLVRAAKMFDPDRGCKFSTYAIRWIQAVMRRHLELDSLVAIPIHVAQLRRDRLKGRAIKPNGLRLLAEADKFTHFQGIDADIPGAEGLVFADVLKSKNTAWEIANLESDKTLIQTLFEQAELTNEERHIISLRFGLLSEDGENMQLKDIANRLNLPYPHVRNAHNRAIRRMRSASSSFEYCA